MTSNGFKTPTDFWDIRHLLHYVSAMFALYLGVSYKASSLKYIVHKITMHSTIRLTMDEYCSCISITKIIEDANTLAVRHYVNEPNRYGTNLYCARYSTGVHCGKLLFAKTSY